MTPEIHEIYDRLKLAAQFVGFAITTAGGAEELRQFIEKASPYANGTMDVILPHFMSITDMCTSQQNLANAIKIAKHLLILDELLSTAAKSEAA